MCIGDHNAFLGVKCGGGDLQFGLGTLALGHIQPDTDQGRLVVDLGAKAVEEIRRVAPILCRERRFHHGLAVLECLGDRAGDAWPVLWSKEFRWMRLGDLLGAQAQHLLQVAVPHQEAAGAVEQVKSPRDGVDDLLPKGIFVVPDTMDFPQASAQQGQHDTKEPRSLGNVTVPVGQHVVHRKTDQNIHRHVFKRAKDCDTANAVQW